MSSVEDLFKKTAMKIVAKTIPIDCLIQDKAPSRGRQAQGPWTDLALHTLGWKAFQDLCAQTCEEILKRPVEVYREAQDGGQDAVFLSRAKKHATRRPATIQCKFTSKAAARLKLSDLRLEEANIATLTAEGMADTYVLMTNMGVDAPIAAKLKKRLRELGVRHPHVLGKEFLTRAIRASSRLRALVPRIYGLGDLSTILDERKAEQTKALLGHMLPTLAVYVPTAAHLDAVRILGKHGLVLLLGDPATGKSTIAAILATTASENAAHPCYKSDGPEGLLENWNPHEPSGFFWIDDAFGPNQPREDFIDRWIAIMPKLQAAMAAGNKFVLTSRRHIYAAAKRKLGSRNHPLLHNEQALVDVGVLTALEREQILYNHVKAGNQSSSWKSRIKPQLAALSKEPALLPEIARRLGDRAFTRQITTANDSLLKFIREPKEHLSQTIEELSKLHSAALTLVFLHRGQMPVGQSDVDMQQLVMKHFTVDAESLARALHELKDSFLVQTITLGNRFWSFKHPTVADAIGGILAKADGMAELYLEGSKSETIVAEAICVGAAPIPDAVVIPETLEALLVERLAELPDEPMVNRRLFSFLYQRASESAFRRLVAQHHATLARFAYTYDRLIHDPTTLVRARAHSLALLPPELRDTTARQLYDALIDDADTSFLKDDTILALMSPTQLMKLSALVRDKVLTQFSSRADDVARQADLDLEPEDNFVDLRESLSELECFFEDDDSASDLILHAASAIDDATESVERFKLEKEAEKEEEDTWDWERLEPAQSTPIAIDPLFAQSSGTRSMFSDVDE